MLTALLPLQIPRGPSPISDEACLSLADSPAAQDAPLNAVERCSSLYPTDVDLLAMVGERYERAQRVDEAVVTYRRALTLEPGYADLRLRLGRLLLGRGDAAGAAREASLALETQANRAALLGLLRDSGRPAAPR
jgi:cytochrome c-type biogenesis protein CcmH/NrfG